MSAISHGVNDAYYLRRGTEFQSYAEAAGQARWLARTFLREVVVSSDSDLGRWSLNGPMDLWQDFEAMRHSLGVRTQEAAEAELYVVRDALKEAERNDPTYHEEHVFEWEMKNWAELRFSGPFFVETPSVSPDDY